MEDQLSDHLFQHFSVLVHRESGINLHEGKRALLQARLGKRMRAQGFSSYRDYLDHVTSPGGAEELAGLLDCVSTNLTHFFREPQHFEYLEKTLLPDLLARKTRERKPRLRFWSAGCSTGEEPYGLAMTALRALSDPRRWDFRVLATDISTRVLAIASRGVYPGERVEKVPEDLRRRYLLSAGSDAGGEPAFEASPELRRAVVFRRLNLKDRYPFRGPFDVIFCRNVMIYFDKETQEELIGRMAGYLAPGGHLFVGHSESLTGLRHPLTYVRPAVYRA